MGMQFEGDESQLLGLVGALDVSKTAIEDRIRSREGWGCEWSDTKVSPNGNRNFEGGENLSTDYRLDLQKGKHNPYHTGEVTTEVEVDRDTALQGYYLAYETIRQRMAAIEQSEPSATFRLPLCLSEL